MNKKTTQWLDDFKEIPNHFHRTDSGDILNIVEDMVDAMQRVRELHTRGTQWSSFGPECLECRGLVPCPTLRALDGEQSRVGHSPSVAFLDEITGGLQPYQARQLSEILCALDGEQS